MFIKQTRISIALMFIIYYGHWCNNELKILMTAYNYENTSHYNTLLV